MQLLLLLLLFLVFFLFIYGEINVRGDGMWLCVLCSCPNGHVLLTVDKQLRACLVAVP